ncbi:caspase family protein [Candidatus Magnetomonas plexicatena]|uniref:caspase family protein n=1 Tax=Candidatus Magnetomonas plexicatena TaxID=2552947 RepID=UPI001C7746E4|nr:hypothetical protein E2O03_013110 [Nitrospirales bacterium LBB_01]
MEILSGTDLSYKYSPATSDANNILNAVSFSLDGNDLYAGGTFQVANYQKYIRKRSNAGKGQHKDILIDSFNTIMQIIPLKNGGIVFGSQDPAFGIFDKNDKKIVFKQSNIADYRGNREEFQISKDAKTIRFWYENQCKSPKVFSLMERELSDVSNSKENLFKPIFKSDKLNIIDWLNETDPKLNGTALYLKQYETSRSLAILPDNSGFLLGTEWWLRLFDSDGKEKREVATPSIAWDVNVSQNGKIAVAAFGDGTIRWYNVSNGKELLAFFPHKDRKRWVLWTPKGYYDASVGGDDLVGWHVNRGKDKEADFFPVSKFRDTYYRPDIVSTVLDTLDEDKAIEQANAQSNIKKKAVDITETLPPVVRILSPKDGTQIGGSEVTIQYEIRTPDDAPVIGVTVVVNGVKRLIKNEVTLKKANVYEVTTAITEGSNNIAVIAENKNAASVPAMVAVNQTGNIKVPQSKPNLYILAIGINNYKNITSLHYAVKDATDFVETVREQEGQLYRKVYINFVLDDNATREHIMDGLDWLSNSKITPNDTVMILLSGHGDNDTKGLYYYISTDTDPYRLKATAVAFSDITSTLGTLPGKIVLFMDTCHAGNVTGIAKGFSFNLNGIINNLTSAENGVIVFASSTGKQLSQESSEWQNGAFTKAVVDGIKGEADTKKTGRVTIGMMYVHITETVTKLTNGEQTPVGSIPITVPNFPIAVVRQR